MRVLHINCNYIGTAMHQVMLNHLAKSEVISTVYVPTYDKNKAIIKPNSNVIVSECFHKWDRIWFDYKQHKIIQDIEKKIDVSEYDLIHAYTLFTDGNCANVLYRKYNIPYIVAVRGTDVNIFLKNMIHLRGRAVRIMREAKRIVFLSKMFFDTVLRKYVPSQYQEEIKSKSIIIPNGVDDFWLENSVTEGKRVDSTRTIQLIYAGRINKSKNIPATQKALAILQEQGYSAKLTVVGKVDHASEYEKIRMDPRTICLPAVPKEQLIEYYRAADIFVMPSFTETFGLVYVESMTQGLPVIYSKGQGFDGQFPEGQVGFAVQADHPDEIANAVVKILQDYTNISNRCIQGSKRFNWDAVCDQYFKMYKSVICMK